MAGALPNIGYHISERELIRGKMCVFLILEPARLLGACKPGSQVRMDSRTGGLSDKYFHYYSALIIAIIGV